MAGRTDVDAGSGAELRRLEEEALGLRERLRRVVVALAMTEETLAETSRRMARAGGSTAVRHRAAARRAAATAALLRDFLCRLEAGP